MKLKSMMARLNACKVDDEVLKHSRLARAGNRLIQLAEILRFIEPALALVAMLILMSAPALAQGGTIFGQDDQSIGNGFRQMIRYGRNLMYLLGVVGVGWAVVNYMTEKAYMKQGIGGFASFGIGGITQLVQSFSQGNAVDLDTDLGK